MIQCCAEQVVVATAKLRSDGESVGGQRQTRGELDLSYSRVRLPLAHEVHFPGGFTRFCSREVR